MPYCTLARAVRLGTAQLGSHSVNVLRHPLILYGCACLASLFERTRQKSIAWWKMHDFGYPILYQSTSSSSSFSTLRVFIEKAPISRKWNIVFGWWELRGERKWNEIKNLQLQRRRRRSKYWEKSVSPGVRDEECVRRLKYLSPFLWQVAGSRSESLVQPEEELDVHEKGRMLLITMVIPFGSLLPLTFLVFFYFLTGCWETGQ